MKTRQENDYILALQNVSRKMFAALQEAKEVISSDLRAEIASIEEALETYNKLHIHQEEEE